MASILVVEDDTTIREVYAFSFELAGHLTSTARDGLAALEALDLELPDLIVLDLRMPRMNGFQFLETIRKHMIDKPMRVLITTAYTTKNLEFGWPVIGVLNKPVDYQQMFAIIDAALDDDPYYPGPELEQQANNDEFYTRQAMAQQESLQFKKNLWIETPALAAALAYMENLSGIIHDLVNSLGILKENLKLVEDSEHFDAAVYCLDVLQCLRLLRFKFDFFPNIDKKTGKSLPLKPLCIKTEFAEVGRRNQVRITGNRLLLSGVLDRKLIRQGIWAALESVGSFTTYSSKSRMDIENVSEPGQALVFVFPTELPDDLLKTFLNPTKVLGMHLERGNIIDKPMLGLFILDKVLALHGGGQYKMLGQGKLKVTLPIQTLTIERENLEKSAANLEQDIEALIKKNQERPDNYVPDILPLVAGYALTMYDELETIREDIAAKIKEPDSSPLYVVIQRNCRLSQLLLRNLLSLTGEFKAPTAEPVNAVELLANTRDMLRNKVGEDIELISNLKPDLPLVLADETALQQIFMNLIINADEAIDDEGEITLSANHQDSIVLIEISDTGCGIEPEIIDRIFDLNFSTKGRGSGVGLYVVKNLIEGFGGEINVKSKVGEGTTFSITLLVADSS